MNADKKCDVGEWPFTIAKLIGKKALNTAHGKRHFQLRKVMTPFFLPAPTMQYIARTVEIAEIHCQQWVSLGHVSGEHAVKDFAFHVSLLQAVSLRVLCGTRCPSVQFVFLFYCSQTYCPKHTRA